MVTQLSKSQRDDLLQRYAESLHSYAELQSSYESATPGAGRPDETRTEQVLRIAEAAGREYFQRLPRVAVSCCPIDGKTLYRTIDPYGFDGLWWRSDAAPAEPPSCPHFCLLRGAVNLYARPVRSGDFAAQVGPEAPYVIPRILEKPGVLAVTSQI